MTILDARQTGPNSWDATPPQCFAGSTKILTQEGETRVEKEIASLKVGDIVLSWNEASKKLVAHRIKKISKPKLANITQISHAHGDLLATGSHSVLTEKGYREVNEIKVGDKLVVMGENDVPTLSVVTGIGQAAPDRVYNLKIEGSDNNFIANGVVAHSDTWTAYSSGPKRVARVVGRFFKNLVA